MREKGNAYNILVVKLEVKTPLGRPRFGWKINAKTRLKELGCQHVKRIRLSSNGLL
jgi:hypothetical protein